MNGAQSGMKINKWNEREHEGEFQAVGKYSPVNKVVEVWESTACLGNIWIIWYGSLDPWVKRRAAGDEVGKVDGVRSMLF